MSRPLRKSPPIQFRLPIDLWPFLEARAEKRGLTPSEYVRSVIQPALEADQQKGTP